MAYIEINDCSKVIKKTTILDHIDLKLEKNRIYGFVGRNGSGKTMLFKILTGLAQPSSGEIRINGQRVSPQSGYPAKLGVMIENNGLWPYLTAFENLSALAAIRRELSDEEIAAVIERVGLSNDGKKFAKYSLGMKQRLVFAQAIMEKPELLILDEPTNALDTEEGARRDGVDRQPFAGGFSGFLRHDHPDGSGQGRGSEEGVGALNKKAKRVTLAKLLCLVMAVMTVGALLLGALTRASYRHDVADAAKSPDTKILYHSKVILSGDKEGTGTFQDSLFQADIIVRAEVAGPEEYQFQALLVPLRIKEVLKGDVKAGDLIDFYEISFFSKAATGQVTYFDVSPFNPMQPGREYIVFAKKIIFHPAYQARLERDVYRAVSLEASYFLPEITEPPILDESETIYFQNVKENEFNCYSKEQRYSINRVKREILSRLNLPTA